MPVTLPGDVEDEQGTSPGALAEQDQVDAAFRDIAGNYEDEAFRDITEHYDDEDTGAEPQTQASNVTGNASGSKLKKRLLIGGGIGGGSVTILLIIFFLLLFKNIHIKNLFIAAEFARFNSAFGNRLERAVNDPEAAPAANSDGLVQPTDSPEQALDKIDSSKIDELKTDPKAMDDAVTQTEILDQSGFISGTSASIDDPALGIDDTITDVSGDNAAKIQTETDTAIQDEVNQGFDGKGAPNQAVQDAVDDTNKAIDAGATSAELDTAAQAGFARGLSSVTSTLSGPFVVATIACIARDIFSAPGHIITAIRFQGLARSAATVNKYADCQKQSKCSLPQVADIAQKFDNSSQSFTQSCAYLRDSGQVGKDCTELDSNYQPVPAADSVPAALVRLSTTLDGKFNIPVIGAVHIPIDTVCSFFLKPIVQYIAAGINVGAATVAAVSGVADFGISDVAVASVEGGSAVLASTAGKALAVHAALYYGGNMFHHNFSPPDWGNLMGGGDKAMATAACISNGCRRLSAKESADLQLQIYQNQIQQNHSRGLAWQLFSPHNPTSTLGLVVDKMPSSPQAATASIGHFFGTVFDPGRFAKSFLALINPVKPAWAADPVIDTYGIPDYGFTSAELSQWSVVENSRWVQQNIIDPAGQYHSQQAGYDKCFDLTKTKVSDLLTGDVSGCDSSTMQSLAFQHYRIYKLDQRVTQDLALLNNNQDGTGGSNSPGPTSTTGCINPFTDPGWGLSRTDQGVDYTSSTPLPVYAICDGTILSLQTPGWPFGDGNGHIISQNGPFIYYKFDSTPNVATQFQGKCVYVAENLTNVHALGHVKAGEQIATTIPGSPNTEWGWAQGPGTPATPAGSGDHNNTPGGQAFARFILSLGGPVRDTPPNPTTGPLYVGASCP